MRKQGAVRWQQTKRGRRRKPGNLLYSRVLLYLVSKASAPDWEYRVTPYIVTSTLPLFLLLSVSRCFLCFIPQRWLPETIYSLPDRCYISVFSKRISCAFDECSNESFLVFFSVSLVFKRSEMYFTWSFKVPYLLFS